MKRFLVVWGLLAFPLLLLAQSIEITKPATGGGGMSSINFLSGGSAFGSGTGLDFYGFSLGQSGANLTITNSVSATAPIYGDGSPGAPLFLGIGTGLDASSGDLTLNGPVQVGGVSASEYTILNLVGFGVGFNSDVLTITNMVSADSTLSGNGSVGSPLAIPSTSVTGTGPANVAGNLATHVHLTNLTVQDQGSPDGFAHTVNISGSMAILNQSAGVATVQVSPTTFQNAGGSDYGSFPYLRLGSGFVITQPLPDVIEIAVPAPSSTVSVAAPITGDGSGGSPVGLAFSTGLINSGGSLTLNQPIQVGGVASGSGHTLDFVGFAVGHNSGVTTVTNQVSVSSPLTGNGSGGTPVDIAIGDGLYDLGGSLTLNGAVQIAGVAMGTYNKLSLVGFGVGISSDVLTITNSVSTTGLITGSGTAASPITIAPSALGVLLVEAGNNVVLGGNAQYPIASVDSTTITPTRANLQAVTTDSLVGRDTAGTGAAETITLGAELSLNGSQVLNIASTNVTGTGPANVAGTLATHVHLTNLTVQDQGSPDGFAHTVNVSSDIARLDQAAGVATVQITPTTFQIAGDTIGSAPYINFSSGFTGSVQGGVAHIAATASGGGADVQVFTSDGTWTKPSGKTWAQVVMIGGGAGGGSGRKGITSDRSGGQGGTGGGFVTAWVLVSALGATEAVVVGTGGAGGAAQSTNSTNGNAGTAGEDTTFDNFLARGGEGGTSGNTSSASSANPRRVVADLLTNAAGSNAGAGNSTATGGTAAASLLHAPATAGGGGGGVNAAGTTFGGGAGGTYAVSEGLASLNAGGAAGANPAGAGGAGVASAELGGTGGGGGGGGLAAAGGVGGAGALYGAAGGGGGAGTDAVGNSGAGGAGAAGRVVVICY